MVFIAGSATTAFGEYFDRSLLDLLEESIDLALTDSKLSLSDIDAIYVGNMLAGAVCNLQHLGSQLAGHLNLNIPIYFSEAACASGGLAVHQAWKDIHHGYFQNVLVVGGEKMTELSPKLVNQYLNRAASLEEQMSGISFCGLYALMAQRYLDLYHYSIEDLAYAPALMHRQATKNPKAHFYKKNFSLEDINQARMIASPLNLLHCSPLSDGASAVVLTRKETRVKISGSSIANDCPGLDKRDSLTSIKATKIAIEKLGLPDDWLLNCHLLELHDCFSIGLVMALEDLGVCQTGQAPELLKALYLGQHSSNLEINPSGGLKAGGHPVGATGVKQIHSLFQRLHKSPEHTKGLAQNIGGTGGTAVIHTLETC